MLTMLRKRGTDAFKIGNLSLGQGGKLLDPRAAIPLADLAATTGLTYFGDLGRGIDVALRLAASDSDFQVLSRPTLFTTNNNPVNITSGQSIPIQSSSQNLGTAGGLISNVQYQDVLLSLSVVPLINTPDEITLQIAQSNSELGTERSIGGALYPELSKQEYNTTIVCRNKSTVLLGGLMRKDDRKTNTTIPFISKLPILKHLTSDRAKTVSQRELLIFIEPRIVEGMHDLPPSINDSVGKSIHAENMRAAFEQEKHDAATRAQPVEKLKASEHLKRMVKKLFE
jgi:type II secretory pathway component GspD/PulD (secretin)